jgi:hypothetical protein
MFGVYRREDDWNLVELKISDPAQLLNSMDPSPFRERDLDPDAAAWLVDALRELREHRRVKIVVHLPGQPDAQTAADIRDAISHFFQYRATAAHFALREVLRLGRASLAVGLLFLAVCTFLWVFVFTGEGIWQRLLHEGALIMGWVAMWRPLEILLYDWWPVLRDLRLYRRISALPVEIRHA